MTLRLDSGIIIMLYAPVVKLADTIDLGSIASGVQVQVLSGAPDEFLSTHSRYEELFYLVTSKNLV